MIPLYPSESEIAALVMGKRAKDWPRTAKHLESKHGLPPIDALMGGRYWPSVEAFFRGFQGLPALDGTPPPRTVLGIRVVPPRSDSHGQETQSASSGPNYRRRLPAD
jgi:hypothetical protein